MMAKSSGSPAGFFVPNIKNFLTAATTSKSWLTFYGLSNKKIFGGVGGSPAGGCVGVIGDFYWTECKKRTPIKVIEVLYLAYGHRVHENGGVQCTQEPAAHRHSSTDVRIRQALRRKFFPGKSRPPGSALALAFTAR